MDKDCIFGPLVFIYSSIISSDFGRKPISAIVRQPICSRNIVGNYLLQNQESALASHHPLHDRHVHIVCASLHEYLYSTGNGMIQKGKVAHPAAPGDWAKAQRKHV